MYSKQDKKGALQTIFIFADYALTFAKLIARTAKDVDSLVDSLPSEESSLKVQVIQALNLFS